MEHDATERGRVSLLKALARAGRWQRLLESGECASITELAGAEKIHRYHLCGVLRLMLLAPELVEAIMDCRHPEGLTLPAILKGFGGVGVAGRVVSAIEPASHCAAGNHQLHRRDRATDADA